MSDLDASLDDHVGDDLLRLMFISCHPVLSTEARVALTLRLLGGLTTDEIARAFLVPDRDHCPAHRAREEDAERREGAVRGAARCGARGPARVGARGDLPGVQRGLLRHRGRRLDAPGPLRGCAAARARAGGARPERAGGARARGADGNPGVALPCAGECRRANRSCCSTRTARSGTGCSSAAALRRWTAPRRSAGRRGPTPCRRPSRPATHGRVRRTRPTGPASRRSTRRWRRLTPSPVVELNRAVAVSMAFGPGRGPRAGGRSRIGAVAQGLSPAAKRPRRPAHEAGQEGRGKDRVRACRGTHAATRANRPSCSRVPPPAPPAEPHTLYRRDVVRGRAGLDGLSHASYITVWLCKHAAAA